MALRHPLFRWLRPKGRKRRTQAELAKRAGIPRSTLSTTLSGKRPASKAVSEKLARATGGVCTKEEICFWRPAA